MGTDAREGKINKVESKHQESVDKKLLSETKNMLQTYFLTKAINNDDRKQKERLRNSIIEIVRKGNNKEFEAEIRRLLYRPKNEMYIPIPKARKFHDMHPDFFGAGIGTFKENSKKLKLPKDQRKFNLIFEPWYMITEKVQSAQSYVTGLEPEVLNLRTQTTILLYRPMKIFTM